MDYQEQISYLHSFVKGIQDYYILSKYATDGAFTLPRKVVAFALSGCSPDEQRSLLESLRHQQYIVDLNENEVTFSSHFSGGKE